MLETCLLTFNVLALFIYTQNYHIICMVQNIIVHNGVEVFSVNRFVFEEHTLKFWGIGFKRIILKPTQWFLISCSKTLFIILVSSLRPLLIIYIQFVNKDFMWPLVDDDWSTFIKQFSNAYTFMEITKPTMNIESCLESEGFRHTTNIN